MGTSRRWTAHALLDEVFDAGSIESWDAPIDLAEVDRDYRAEIRAAAGKSGCDESIITGRAAIGGRPVAFVVNEFGFLAGSIGRAAAARIIAAVRRATDLGLPLFASTASGGTRMQEGTPAFVEMLEIGRALVDHKAAGLGYFVHLRHPTTGGVFASWGALGHVTVAEPSALVGFLGPKVVEAVTGVPMPDGVQRADHLAAIGVIDGLVAVDGLRTWLGDALTVLDPSPRRVVGPGDANPDVLRRESSALEPDGVRRDVWADITATRGVGRPTVRDLIAAGDGPVVELHGTGTGERDDAVVVALTRIGGLPVVLAGQDGASPTPMGPAGLRQVQRAARVAADLRIPLVTVVDTAGAALTRAAEEGAVAPEIGRTIAALASLTVPTVSVILGQGCGGGALALLPARTMLAVERGWLSPLPPEGASVIVHGDVSHAPAMAQAQRVAARDLLAAGHLHAVIPEHADDTPAALATAVVAEIAHHLR